MNTATRKSPAHPTPLYKSGSAPLIFLTVCSKARRRIFDNHQPLSILTELWRTSQRWKVGKFVLMPDHIHLFCAPTRYSEPLETWIGFWKRGFSKRFKSPLPLWQKNFWDTQMRSDSHYNAQWEYVEQNSVRAGLAMTAKDWPFKGELERLAF